MFHHSLTVASLLFLLSTQLIAADVKIKRSIKKEPAYQSSPRYCLMLLGTEPTTSVWLVLDGDVLYADLNGNGDLTEPEDRLNPQKRGKDTHVFKVDSIRDRSGRTHKDFFLSVERDGQWQLQIDVDESTRQRAFIDEPAKKLKQARIVHFGGPLKMRLWRAKKLTLSRAKPTKLGALIVTQYGDVEFTYVTKGVPDFLYPIAEITFASKSPKGKPITVKFPLKKRDTTLFFDEFRVPADAKSGKAKVVLSFPDWKQERVASAIFEVKVVNDSDAKNRFLDTESTNPFVEWLIGLRKLGSG